MLNVLLNATLSIPMVQLILLMLMSTMSLLFGKLKLALLINYLFTLHWGYIFNRNNLMDMGIENFLISSTLLGVLAQRLTRKLCLHCKEEALLSPAIAEEIEVPQEKYYFKAVGCKECDFTGYKGRQAIGELFIIDDKVKEMMKDEFNDHQVREFMKKNGMKTISDKLKEMLLSGETSYEEAIRVGLMDG